MKIRKYIYLFVIAMLLFLATSCSFIKNYEIKIYDGNGKIIDTLSVKKGYKIDLNTYGVQKKDSDELYDYYFSGWNCDDLVVVKETMEIHPEFEKLPIGLEIEMTNRYDGENYYYIKRYKGNHTHLEIPGKVGFPLSKERRIEKYVQVKSISEEAFIRNDTLEEVILPEGIKRIGEYAFYDCISLKKINIPSTVTKINESTFERCESLQEINIPTSIIEIGDSAFEYCSSLKEIDLRQNNNIQISKSVFYNCTNLEIAYLPNSLTRIPASLFYGCENLKIVNIDSEITSVDGYAFGKCKQLDLSFIDFSKLEVIGESAFTYCIVPSKLDLSKVELGDNAFDGCTTLEEVILNENTEKIIGFNHCTNLSYINFNALLNLSYIYGLEDINIKTFDFSNHENLNTLNIFNSRFVYDEIKLHHDVSYRPTAKKITILNGEISGDFSKELEEIIMPSDLKVIPKGMFENCINLTSITLPDTLTTIEDSAFKGCKSLETINIPKSVTTIGMSAFSFCEKLEQVIFEEGSQLKNIDDYTFYCCSNLHDINIEACEEIEIIESYAFGDCLSLANFKFDKLENLTTIEENAFQNTNIRIMKLPNKLVSLGDGLPKLLSFIYIPNSLANLDLINDIRVIYAYQNASGSYVDNKYRGVSPEKIHYDEEGFVYLLNDDSTATIIRYCGLNRDVVTPSSINVGKKEYTVDKIGNYAFGGDFITSLKISDSIKSANYYLFAMDAKDKYKGNTSLRVLSVGANFEYKNIYIYENATSPSVKSGYREYWYSVFNLINSEKEYEQPYKNNRYRLGNLINGEYLNTKSEVLIGSRLHSAITYIDYYPSYKETYKEADNNYLSSLNSSTYDIPYEIIDGFIFTNQKTVCLGYLGEYKTHLVLPTLEEGYECSFIINEYHCNTYDVPENVTLKYK